MISLIQRWRFYHGLIWRDIVRLWPTTQHQVVIIAGICLPILLLMGLKRGHVAELRTELLTSPTGRQVVFYSSQQGELLDESTIDQLQRDITGAELIVLELNKLVGIYTQESTAGAPATQPDENGDNNHLLTLYATRLGDPILGQYDADVLEAGELAIVLADIVAKDLGVQRGDSVSLLLRRRKDEIDESHWLPVQVKAIIPSSGGGDRTGYADVLLLKALEQYVRGSAVPEYQLPVMKGLSAEADFQSYLLYCQRGAQMEPTEDDFEYFAENGIEYTEVTDMALKSLQGMLSPERMDELLVFQLTQRKLQDGQTQTMRLSPLKIVANTQAIDDIAIRWNPPTLVQVGNKEVRLLGLSLPTFRQTGGWIRDYLVSQDSVFDFETSDAKPFSIIPTANGSFLETGQVTVSISESIEITLRLQESDSVTRDEDSSQGIDDSAEESKGSGESTNASVEEELDGPITELETNVEQGPTTAVVPANLLALIRLHSEGKVIYDPTAQVFSPIPGPIRFGKARLYTHTIDEIPTAVEQLSSRGFGVQSEGSRIAEIHDQDRSLQLLVIVVGAGVFLFGVVTVVSVLVDSTDRKRGTIGILRVMGMSRTGIFYVVVLRAMIIGVLAALASIALGYLMSALLGLDVADISWLSWKPMVQVVIDPYDLLIVFVGALVCSGCGALIPACRAGAMDPFDAIIEGRFH